jgi:hypothetical protein
LRPRQALAIRPGDMSFELFVPRSKSPRRPMVTAWLPCHRRWETDPVGNSNLTHPPRWFLREGGADAHGGGEDGVGGSEEARGGDIELARVTGASRNTVRRYLSGGDATAVRKPAPKQAKKLDPFKAYIVDRVKAAAGGSDPGHRSLSRDQGRGYEGRRDASEAVRARARAGAGTGACGAV